MTVVLDTSVLVYWTLDPDRLTAAAKQALEGAASILVSSISIWEIGVKQQKGRLSIPLSVNEFAERLRRVEHVEILPVDVEIWLMNLALDWEHRDPADRTIVATALRHDATLIASDAVIQTFYPRTIW
jgi:PIN domain nuclease of toxin-antitoxin system